MPGIVVYASKYGSTREYATLIAGKLNTRALRASEAPSETVSGTGFIVLGSPIYACSVLPEMEKFLKEKGELLAKKPMAAFVVCGDTMWNPQTGEGGQKNLRKLTRLLPSEPFTSAVFGGRMRMEDLDEVDGPRIRAFYERIGREATGFDRMELEKVGTFVGMVTKYPEGGV